MQIQKADFKDLQIILNLQYLAYQSEAQLLNNYNIPPLKQTLSELKDEYKKGTVLKAVCDSKIVGSVRAYKENGTVYIGKLIVHPDFQRRGIGTALLYVIENACPCEHYELFTSDKSSGNIRLYEKIGYRIFKHKDISEDLRFVFLEKTKRQITINLDSDTIDYFKLQSETSGIPYQTLINLYLSDCAAQNRQLHMKWE